MDGHVLVAPLRDRGRDFAARVHTDERPRGHVDRWSKADPFPELTPWRPILDLLDIKPAQAIRIAASARLLGIPFEIELVAAGHVAESLLYEALAASLGLAYAPAVDPGRLIVRDSDCRTLLDARWGSRPVRVDDGEGRTVWAVTPDGRGIDRLRRHLRHNPKERARIWIVAPRTLRAALLERAGALLSTKARNDLFDYAPQFSARIVASAWQGAAIGCLLALLPVAIALAPQMTVSLAHGSFTFFFLACVWLRFAAVRAPPRIPAPDFSGIRLGDLPTYSVVVALHREANVVAQLLRALDALVWPRGKLEIKLACEADDGPTLAAIRAHGLPSHIELLEVPPGEPRTKPKALCFALQLVTGDFVVLYDAEDRPHPMQLMEAWRRFSRAPDNLACLQAPLEISNGGASIVSRLFAFEYCGLFRGLLPWLAGKRVVLPLGGTSNHLRLSSLRAAGGWDPYNVTEDADLGVRLARFGFRTETLTLPTYEDAPESLGVWVPQRTRWFKGWLQTWLVHMRHPALLCAQLGLRSFAVTQILSAGMVVSALVHPLLIATALYVVIGIITGQPPGLWQSSLLVIDIANIACGYASFLLLGWQQLKPAERKGFWRIVLFTPAYWLMLSWAAWRALWHLFRRPHHWEKTPHFVGKRELTSALSNSSPGQ